MGEKASEETLGLIQTLFPLHYAAIHSLIFTRRSLEPAERRKSIHAAKLKAVANHFLALLRVRNQRLLMHRSIIATLAMYHKGMPLRVSRNPVFKAFSCSLRTAFKYLERIYEDTREERDKAIQSQQVLVHGSDNYNQFHPHAIQVGSSGGIMHIGMVYNMMQVKVFLLPVGTVYKDPNGVLWKVINAKMPDAWTCIATLTRIPTLSEETAVER